MLIAENAAAGISPFFQWFLAQLYAIAGIRTPFLTSVFSVLTYLGHEMGFLVIAIILLWCLNKKYGYRLLIVFMVATFLSQFLKAAFMIPRPWVLDPNFDPFVVQSAKGAATGFSFPSGHTMTACLSLGALAVYFKKKWLYAVSAVLILLVGFSRMYLGVHTLLDVVVGLLIGAVVMAVFEAIFKGRDDNATYMNVFMFIGLGLSVCLMGYLLLTKPADGAKASVISTHAEAVKDAAKFLGAAVGMVLAKLLDDRFIHFETETVWWKQIIKAWVGMAIIVLIWFGFKKILPSKPIFDGIRYFLMAFVGIGIYPMCFKRFYRPVG